MAEGDVIALVKETFDTDMAREIYEDQLERALYARCKIIIIEPDQLGDETARWIRIGNGLHYCAIIFGLSSVCLSVSWNRYAYKFLVPLTLVSVFCAGLYMISWQFDPCCKYQVANAEEKMALIEKLKKGVYSESVNDYLTVSKLNPVFILRKDDRIRKIIHSAVAAFAFTCTIIRLYK